VIAAAVSHIRLIEELAANAWPPTVVMAADGWQLRFNWGVTRRANSVLPLKLLGATPIDERIRTAEEFYRAWGGPSRFQISPDAQPAELDDILAARGYAAVMMTHVQAAPIEAVLVATHTDAPLTVTISETLDDDWLRTYQEAENVSDADADARAAIMRRIQPQTAFAQVQHNAETVAVGMGVLERSHLGLFNMVTRPAFRRQGAATALLHALAQWGVKRGVNHVYLQVTDANQPARSLYERIGFETLYTYHYREQRA
jgi:N-acetylglutamate synthase